MDIHLWVFLLTDIHSRMTLRRHPRFDINVDIHTYMDN